MNRLQKKCLIVSGGLHVLLVLLVIVGPGFMSSKTAEPNLPEINFVPSMLVDAALAGGGNPNARQQPPVANPTVPPAPATPPPPPPKAAAKAPEPEVVEPVRTAKAEADSLEPSKPKKPVLNIPTKLQNRSTPTKTHTRDKRAEEAEAQEAAERAAERQAADERRRLARQFTAAANGLRSGSATSGIEDVEFGPGGGGPTYASLAAWIQRVYEDAWVPPENTAVDTAVAYATITIARDGSVVSAALTTNSGDSQVDASVRRTLNRVTTIGRPFPEGVKDKERTYKLKFDLKAKRQMA